MKMYDTVKTCSTPEEARKEFEAAMKQWETERAAAQAAKAAYASHLTEIANRMLNHAETAEDVAFIVNTYLTDKLGPQDDGDPYLTADGISSVLECLSALKNLTIPGSKSRSDDETISKFLDDILGL